MRQEVRRLHKLAEARATRSEWSVLPPGEDNELRSVMDQMEGTIPNGQKESVRREEEEEREALERKLAESLNGDGVARGVLDCLCDGVVRRREIKVDQTGYSSIKPK